MNSRTGKQPPEPPGGPREKIEAIVSSAVMEIIQLRRTLWLVLRSAGGPVVVDEKECHPLWRMKATRQEDGKMKLEAMQLPDPTFEQLAGLAERLNGTQSPLGDAMQEAGLGDYPPQYIEKCLRGRVVQLEDGQWVDDGENFSPGNN